MLGAFFKHFSDFRKLENPFAVIFYLVVWHGGGSEVDFYMIFTYRFARDATLRDVSLPSITVLHYVHGINCTTLC